MKGVDNEAGRRKMATMNESRSKRGGLPTFVSIWGYLRCEMEKRSGRNREASTIQMHGRCGLGLRIGRINKRYDKFGRER